MKITKDDLKTFKPVTIKITIEKEQEYKDLVGGISSFIEEGEMEPGLEGFLVDLKNCLIGL